jgi:hypothetical protein
VDNSNITDLWERKRKYCSATNRRSSFPFSVKPIVNIFGCACNCVYNGRSINVCRCCTSYISNALDFDCCIWEISVGSIRHCISSKLGEVPMHHSSITINVICLVSLEERDTGIDPCQAPLFHHRVHLSLCFGKLKSLERTLTFHLSWLQSTLPQKIVTLACLLNQRTHDCGP